MIKKKEYADFILFSRIVITNSTMVIETVDSCPQKRLSINTHLGLKFPCSPHGKRMFPP